MGTENERRPRLSRVAARIAPGLMSLLLVCLAAGGVLGHAWGPRPARILQNGSPYGTTVGVVDIYLPKTIVVQFPPVVGSGTSYDPNTQGTTTSATSETWFRSTTDPIGTGTNEQLYARGAGLFNPALVYDSFDFQPGTRYYYTAVSCTVSSTSYPNNQPPPSSSTTYKIEAHFSAVPVQAVAADTQSVDARYDPRYATWVHLNHNFGTTTYRGGLYAGCNADNSSVGHAYMKFGLTTLPTGATLWPNVGSVNAYYNRSYANGSTVVACRSVDASWGVATLSWTTAPAFVPQNAPTVQQTSVTYDGTSASQSWTHWRVGGETGATSLLNVAANGGAYAAALGGASEPPTTGDPIPASVSGWAYFSKQNAPDNHPPCVLYAYH